MSFLNVLFITHLLFLVLVLRGLHCRLQKGRKSTAHFLTKFLHFFFGGGFRVGMQAHLSSEGCYGTIWACMELLDANCVLTAAKGF